MADVEREDGFQPIPPGAYCTGTIGITMYVDKNGVLGYNARVGGNPSLTQVLGIMRLVEPDFIDLFKRSSGDHNA